MVKIGRANLPKEVKFSATLFFISSFISLIRLFVPQQEIPMGFYIFAGLISIALSLLAGFLIIKLNNGGRIFALVLAWISLLIYTYEIVNFFYILLQYKEMLSIFSFVLSVVWVIASWYIIRSLTDKDIKSLFKSKK